MRTPTNSGRVSLRVHTSPVTDATVCMRTFAPHAVIDMVLSVPNAMHAPGLRGRGSPKSLLHERSAKHGVYWPTSVPAHAVEHVVVHHNGTREVVPPPPL
jgi:hypothetical protein